MSHRAKGSFHFPTNALLGKPSPCENPNDLAASNIAQIGNKDIVLCRFATLGEQAFLSHKRDFEHDIS